MAIPDDATMVQLEASTVCGASCLFCHRPRMRRKSGTMERWVFEKILHDARDMGISEILLFLYGEPFLFNPLFDWLQRLREESCTTVLFSNGVHLTEEKARQLLQLSDVVGTIVFSVAGIDQETEQRIMGLDYELVERNILRLIELKDTNLQIHVHTPKASYTEPFLDRWVNRWQGVADGVGVTPLFNNAGKTHDELELCENEDHRRYYCQRLNHIIVLWDGTVPLCCWDAEAEVVLGNVRTDSLQEIFFSERARSYRDIHKQGAFSEIALCRDCNANILNITEIEAMEVAI